MILINQDPSTKSALCRRSAAVPRLSQWTHVSVYIEAYTHLLDIYLCILDLRIQVECTPTSSVPNWLILFVLLLSPFSVWGSIL